MIRHGCRSDGGAAVGVRNGLGLLARKPVRQRKASASFDLKQAGIRVANGLGIGSECDLLDVMAVLLPRCEARQAAVARLNVHRVGLLGPVLVGKAKAAAFKVLPVGGKVEQAGVVKRAVCHSIHVLVPILIVLRLGRLCPTPPV